MNIAVDIGFADTDRVDVAEGLSKVLADTYALYLKTHGYHWNVTGATFPALHTLFEGAHDKHDWMLRATLNVK
jgi:starvation-inducible DNA-binding protein